MDGRQQRARRLVTPDEEADAVLEALGSVRIRCSHCGELHWAKHDMQPWGTYGEMTYVAKCDTYEDSWTYITPETYEAWR